MWRCWLCVAVMFHRVLFARGVLVVILWRLRVCHFISNIRPVMYPADPVHVHQVWL